MSSSTCHYRGVEHALNFLQKKNNGGKLCFAP